MASARIYMQKREVLWSPFAKQARFLTCPAFEVLYGGAAGSGKTDGLLISALQGVVHADYRGLLLMRKYVDAERSMIPRSQLLYRGRAKFNAQRRTWTFGNGAVIEIGYLSSNKDLESYNQPQYSFLGIDDLTHFLEDQYLFMFSRVRTVNPNLKCKIRCCTNPGGVGHAWVKRRFWIGEKEGDRIYDVEQEYENPDGIKEKMSYGRAFIPANVYDNDWIIKNDKEYLMRLLQLPDAKKKALLYGLWDAYEGQFFSEWNHAKHVCAPFEIPSNWVKTISFDWGYEDPCCVLWEAQDPKDGTVYVYRELYTKHKTDEVVAGEILEFSKGEEIQTVYYPFDLDFRNPQTGISMKERMDDIWLKKGRRFYLKEGAKDRKNGWSAVRHLLSFRANGTPRMRIFNTCKNLIRTIPEQVHCEDGQNFGEDLDTNGEDHAVDALRYFAATYRKLNDVFSIADKEDDKIRDVGSAVKMPNGEYRFKKEPVMNFSWMNE